MTGIERTVIDLNEAFYNAFSNQDFLGMEKIWSSQNNIVVIHPGWPPLMGYHSVISSWKRIMEGGETPKITCINANVSVMGNIAIVVCTEVIAETKLIATNIFALEEEDWKMIHHQASPLHLSNLNKEGDTVH